jgi:hypothetical protein
VADESAWKALGGLRAWGGKRAYEFGVGRYGNGRVAIVARGVEIGVAGEDPVTAEVEATITTNMPEVSLGARTVLVRWNAEPGALTSANEPEDPWRALLSTGALFDSGQRWTAGFVDDYAAGWSLATCSQKTHSGLGGFVVECPECRAAIAAKFDETVTDKRARDSVRSLKELGRVGGLK